MVSCSKSISLMLLISICDPKTSTASQSDSLEDDEEKIINLLPDCSNPNESGKAQCLCRNPSNAGIPICQKWLQKRSVAENIFFHERIIGGKEVPVGEYPWFAKAVRNSNNVWAGCGGSLVSPQYVLTAAHCIGVFDGFEIGAFCLNSDRNCEQESEVINTNNIIVHPDYRPQFFDNDFALVKLSRAALTTHISMDINGLSESYGTTTKLRPIGFGNTENPENGNRPNYPEKLRDVEVSYVPTITCNSLYGAGSITPNMMCAADLNKDSCQGDSGGPLYDKESNVLVGVVSWGTGCADPDFPGVYSRISAQASWIVDTICSDNDKNEKPGFCEGYTSSPTITPTCVDSPVSWYDADGPTYDCSWYNADNCAQYGDFFENDGKTANQACCVCGGGRDISTSSPTSSPEDPSTSSPVANPTGGGERLCQDNDQKFQFKAARKRSCKFIAKDTGSRCDNNAKTNCPVTCETGCKCYDTKGVFQVFTYKRRCKWVKRKLTAKRCRNNIVRSNCPIVCGVCED